MLAAAAVFAAGLFLKPLFLAPIIRGVSAAWIASTASVAALAVSRRFPPKAFWWAFGGGMALRAAVMGVLMASVWNAPGDMQGALLASYALGILFLLLLEYKNLAWE